MSARTHANSGTTRSRKAHRCRLKGRGKKQLMDVLGHTFVARLGMESQHEGLATAPLPHGVPCPPLCQGAGGGASDEHTSKNVAEDLARREEDQRHHPRVGTTLLSAECDQAV